MEDSLESFDHENFCKQNTKKKFDYDYIFILILNYLARSVLLCHLAHGNVGLLWPGLLFILSWLGGKGGLLGHLHSWRPLQTRPTGAWRLRGRRGPVAVFDGRLTAIHDVVSSLRCKHVYSEKKRFFFFFFFFFKS